MSTSFVVRATMWPGAGRRARVHRSPVRSLHGIDGLENRWMLSVATAQVQAPDVQVLSATTTDSKGVTVDYQVNTPTGAATPLTLGVYRSADATFDTNDVLVGARTTAPPGSTGVHKVTLPLEDGLPPFPEKPYVLVVANPGLPSAATDPSQTASFRVYTIGVVTHGGIQNTSWKNGPPWQLQTAYLMRNQGFDVVIPFNWVQASGTPGKAIQQSPRLARMIRNAASTLPSDAVVDLELIGHSEGAVINAYALATLQESMPDSLQKGYVLDILLDPHAANNAFPGQQLSVSGPLGSLARAMVTDYQARAEDPFAYIPSSADEALVFFQHTQSRGAAMYNLWGQVPVKTEGVTPRYFNLSSMGVVHAGKKGVNSWFCNVLASTLGNQLPAVRSLELNAHIDGAERDAVTVMSPAAATTIKEARQARAARILGPSWTVHTSDPVISGTATPGATVRLALAQAESKTGPTVVGITRADSTGSWSLSPWRPLPNGKYRTLITSYSRELTTRPGLAIVPTLPLGRLVVRGR